MNIFIESVKYLLVIATPVEIVILAISFVGDSIDGDIILTPSNLLILIILLIILKI